MAFNNREKFKSSQKDKALNVFLSMMNVAVNAVKGVELNPVESAEMQEVLIKKANLLLAVSKALKQKDAIQKMKESIQNLSAEE